MYSLVLMSAMAGGTDPSRLGAALASVEAWVAERA